MLGKTQIEQITSQEYKWNYITSISKAQINKLLKEGVFQLSLFDDKIAEIEHEGIRYILRRNPIREQEMENNRKFKIAKVKEKIDEKNKYLKEHKKAKEEVALKNLNQYIQKLKLSKILSLKLSERTISIEQNEEAMDEAKKLDGCYVVKSTMERRINYLAICSITTV